MERKYTFRPEYPPEVLVLLGEHEVIWDKMVREDIKRIIRKQKLGYIGREGLAASFAIAHQFPPQDLVIAFIKQVKPELLDELIEKGVVKRTDEGEELSFVTA